MSREEIIRMARESGLERYHLPDSMMEYEFDRCIERFAALVAAAERERCAKVCEAYDDDGGSGEAWALRFAQVIRARGEK